MSKALLEAWLEKESASIYQLLEEVERLTLKIHLQSSTQPVRCQYEYVKKGQDKELQFQKLSLSEFQFQLKVMVQNWLEKAGEYYPLELNLYLKPNQVSSKIIISNPASYFSVGKNNYPC